MRRPSGKRTTSSKKDYYMIITWLALIVSLIFRIPLGRMIGDRGMACFGAANEIYLVTAGALGIGLSEAVSSLVRYRLKRKLYRSADKVVTHSLLLGGGAGILFSILCGLGGGILAEKVMHLPLAGMAVRVMAPSIFFFILTGVLRGYFQGCGSRNLIMHSYILYLFFLITGGLLGAGFWQNYGQKVSALLQNADHAGAYGAMGASIGLLTASAVCFLHALVFYVLLKKSRSAAAEREPLKNTDTGWYIIRMLAGVGAVQILLRLCFDVLPLLDQYLYFSSQESPAGRVSLWGAYYGKYLTVIGICAGIICLICLMPVKRIALTLERGDESLAREKLGALIHQCAAIAIPTAVLVGIFAENILKLLFSANNRQFVLWLQAGSLLIVFYVFGMVFSELLIACRKMHQALLTGAGALLLHLIFLMILLKGMKDGILGIVIGGIIFYALVSAAGFVQISRLFRYTQEWIRCFVITIVASAVSGAAAMLLNRLLGSLIGPGFSMLIGLAAAVPVYIVLLVVTRAFQREELNEIAGGWLLKRLAGLMNY